VKETMRFISHLGRACRSAAIRALMRGWLTLGMLPVIVACSPGEEEQTGLPGEIGSGHFLYECATGDDPHCREELTFFPEKIAVGARFDVEASTSRGSALLIEVASPLMVAPSRSDFVFLRAGVTAFLAVRDRQVHDFAHLRGVEVASIEVQNAFGEGVDTLVLSSGQRTSLTVVPFDDEGDTLAGSLTYRWATDNEAAILVEPTGTTGRIEGLEPGAAQVRVSLGDRLSLTLNVVVNEGAQDRIDGGLDAGSDARVPDAQVPSEGGSSTSDAATALGDAATSAESGETGTNS